MMERLLQENREEILRLAAEYGAHNVRIFGSVARHEARPDSDIDILVDFEQGRSLLDQAALLLALEALLGRKVDVANERALKSRFRQAVLREAVTL